MNQKCNYCGEESMELMCDGCVQDRIDLDDAYAKNEKDIDLFALLLRLQRHPAREQIRALRDWIDEAQMSDEGGSSTKLEAKLADFWDEALSKGFDAGVTHGFHERERREKEARR
jgi:hypothetical protein